MTKIVRYVFYEEGEYVEYRKCPKCRYLVPLDGWYKNSSYCKECMRIIKDKRKRNLESKKIYDNPFDESEDIHWHHIDDTYIVALPAWLHQMYSGYNREKHREILKPYVQQIYETGE